MRWGSITFPISPNALKSCLRYCHRSTGKRKAKVKAKAEVFEDWERERR